MLLKNKVAVVTGSGRGIGRAIARAFAEEGAAVFLCARSQAELASAAAGIGKAGTAGYVVADLTKEEDCRRVVAAGREKFERIDILVNNAGHYGPVVPVEEYPLAEFDKVIAVHLRAAFLMSKLVLPEMYARGSGVILNISSLSAKSAFPWGSAYAAAKAGMLGLTRVTAAEAGRKGAGECALPGAGDRDGDVEGAWRGAGKKAGGQPQGTTRGISQYFAARTRANSRRNCARRAVSLLGAIKRDYRAGHQRGRRRGVFLRRCAASRFIRDAGLFT